MPPGDSEDRHGAADLLAVLLTLAAPVVAAGGATWSWAVLFALAGFTVCLSPEVRRLPWWVNGAFAGLILSGALSLLPLAAPVNFPWWRDLRTMGVELPPTISAQPWLTLHGWMTLTAGALWAWFLIGRQWRLPRRLLLSVFGAGALAIVVWWLAAHLTGRNLAGVTTQSVFGSFPNRNQSANFAALAGIVFAALALDGRLRRRPEWALWLGALGVAVAAVFAAGSRAGVLLLTGGGAAWFWWMSRTLGLSAPVMVLVNGALLLLAGLMAFGGELLKRFNPAGRAAAELALDFRLLLYRDAVPMLQEASWHGVGIGNFAGVFARYRDASFNESRAVHPDSDWIWLVAELGWLAPLCLVALLGFALRQCRPFDEGSERVLRAAGLVGAVAFAVHSLVDVPGHRATVLPALLLLGLAAHPSASGRQTSGWTARAVGVVMMALAAVQLVWFSAVMDLPGPERLRRAKQEINVALDRGQWREAAALASDGLRAAPLDWELYFGRASAGVMTGTDTRNAQRDFAVARYLEPNPEVAFNEGVAWLVRESDFVEASPFIGPRADLAAAAWSHVFPRARSSATHYYGQMLAFAGRYPEIRPYLRELAGTDPARLAMWLTIADDAGRREALEVLLAVSPDLAGVPDERLPLVLRVWSEVGDRERLLREMPSHPRWQHAGWVYLGDALAARGELQLACKLAREHLPAPDLPPPPTEPLESLRASVAARPADVAAGLRYYQKLAELNQWEEALRVVTALAARPGAPAYVNWLEADLRERTGDLAGAWQAWRRAGLR
jgi:O-antigen ligase